MRRHGMCPLVVVACSAALSGLINEATAQPFSSSAMSNQPDSVPTPSPWNVQPEAAPPPANTFGGVLTTPVVTSPMPSQPGESAGLAPFSNRGSLADELAASTKTPIRRTADVGASSSAEAGKPQAADMLKAGAWKSGVTVIVLAAIGIATVVLLKKRHPQLAGNLPREVCDVLGRRRIDPRTSICLVRLGNRLLVLGSTPDGVTSLAEIDDPVEIDQLAGLCRASDSSRLPSFGNLLSKRTRSADSASEPSRQKSQRTASPRGGRELADLPALRDLQPGQKLDLTTP